MKRFATVLFIIVAVVLSGVLILIRRNQLFSDKTSQEETSSYAKVIVPDTSDALQYAQDSDDEESNANTLISMIPLLPSETLLITQDIDFDEDGYDDQINAVKRNNSPYISILVGLFNTATSSYERSATIDTIVTQISTFSLTCMDLTGQHRNTLIYTGITDNSLSVFQAFQSSIVGRSISFTKIADIQTYGSVSIQQISRSDAYSLSQTTGESYPIIESVTDNASSTNSLDQLQIVYNWDRRIGQYVKQSETRIPGGKIAADVLASIQDGTVESFTAFLDGLWYRTTNTDGVRYVFFNEGDGEIVFLLNDTEEVYTWDNNTLRRNGIYMSVVNTIITNLKRRIDITLTGIDEIKIKLDDDVGLLIKTENLWDGQYKKMTSKTDLSAKVQDTTIDNLAYLSATKDWQTADGIKVSFEDNKCTAIIDGVQSIFRIATIEIDNDKLLQFQQESGASLFSGAYKLITGDTPTLVPVDISVSSYTQSSRVPIILTKNETTN